jgi:hypothetical protein
VRYVRAMDKRFDPPAAHSMDTTWYAVDADGYVGAFDSGEPGGVPADAAIGHSEADPTFDVALLDGLVIARMFAAGELPADGQKDVYGPTRAYVVLAPAADETPSTYRDQVGRRYPAQALLSKFDPRVASDRDPRVVVTRKPVSPEKLAELAKAKGVLWVASDAVFWDRDAHEGGPLFSYRNDDYDDAGRYVRGKPPDDPIRVEDLPEEIRDGVAKLKLPIRFVEREEVQLRDHVAPDQVFTWGGTLADPVDEAPSVPAATGARKVPKVLDGPGTPHAASTKRPAGIGRVVAIGVGVSVVLGVVYWLVTR